MRPCFLPLALILSGPVLGSPPPLPGTLALEEETGEARSASLVAGIDRFAMKKIVASLEGRKAFWQRDLSSPEAYETSVEANRSRLRRLLGVHPADLRAPMTGLEYVATTAQDSRVAEASGYVIHAVRWQVLEGVAWEGLYIRQREKPKACVILLPDAGQTPEQCAGLAPGEEALGQAAHELALAGCEVVIPTLVDRNRDFSGSEALGIKTNQSHREWIYRQAFEVGRHVAGYELQAVTSLVDWMSARNLPLAIAGYGEGGWLALLASAIDTRVQTTLVCGAFENRNDVWSQPLDRNFFGLLREFGDAEIASLVLPRTLLVSYGRYPETRPEPEPAPGVRKNAAPGTLSTPELQEVRDEVQRLRQLVGGRYDKKLRLILPEEEDTAPFPSLAVEWLRRETGLVELAAPSALKIQRPRLPDAAQRQHRLVRGLEAHVQRALQGCERERNTRFWKKLPLVPGAELAGALAPFREEFWSESIGRLPDPSESARPRSRFLYETDAFTAWEVMLDVWPEVTAWGWLLLPKGLAEGERRPVVVCQHGLEGLPADVVNEDPSSRAFAAYKGFAASLARQGYVTFAPHNFYRGRDAFRVIQRKLNPLGLSLFSVVIGQHQQMLSWLKEQPFVDPARIAFYGLSYGGKSAMRIPAVLPDYCLSICSGDFNEWVRKCATTDLPLSYVFTGEYEIWDWNLGGRFNYAEMAALIAPRPFMVERGHDDGVALDEWVAYEYAKVFRFYNKRGLGNLTEIEYFDGPHTIHGAGTFQFLGRHLRWPPAP